ncbi:hisA/hisF family protein [Methanocaldococcus infernus ME]|uniref:HisA/hisF family protein n=1 Tax=Methanocaldococcus infernus (strain DSM 11812 / JCM 15783 / ME) TaxID=573063 RepID=D5VUD2_METIM|nr:HisA/HisF family protein [Methanocaldococcus infernus]ADG12744.1 hisA/hisF family protein [Methanocaldococcus infernus ME]
MEIVPVIDIMKGLAVSGKGGERSKYRPLTSILSPNPNPIELAKIYKDYGVSRIYIADLDKIMGVGDNFDIIKSIDFINKMVDVGVRDREDYEKAKSLGEPIVGTETVRELGLLKEAIVSLDFKDGKLLNYNLEDILNYLGEKNEVIVLDISSVGTGRGINRELIRNIRELIDNPLYVGGGLKDIRDLEFCYSLDIDGVLIGTAIHKGILNLKEIVEVFR